MDGGEALFSDAFDLYIDSIESKGCGNRYLNTLDKRFALEEKLSNFVNTTGALLKEMFLPGVTKHIIPPYVVNYAFSRFPLRKYGLNGEATYSRQGAFEVAMNVSDFIEDLCRNTRRINVEKNGTSETFFLRQDSWDINYRDCFTWNSGSGKWMFKLPLNKKHHSIGERLKVPARIFSRPTLADGNTLPNRHVDINGIHWKGYDYESREEYTLEPLCQLHLISGTPKEELPNF